jgi:N-acetylmuramoyl-L-alanine amidase
VKPEPAADRAQALQAPDTALAGRLVPSPNHGPRPPARQPDALILHYTGMASAEEAIAWLADPASRVSAHYVIDEDGTITQMVAEALRAWHAGVSCWHGESDMNSASIGIEIHNRGHAAGLPDYPAAQMEAVAALCRDIAARWTIAPERVLAHSDIAPGRKIDPGERFDWGWLASQQVGVWVPPAPLSPEPHLAPGASGRAVRALGDKLRAYGYRLDDHDRYDRQCTDVVAAFQRHFRPARVDGHADGSTIDTLERLLNFSGRGQAPCA